jgi:DNA mismatch repair protein MutH
MTVEDSFLTELLVCYKAILFIQYFLVFESEFSLFESFLGRSFGQIAQEIGFPLQETKGCLGHLVERLLGARSSNSPGPDLPHLGLEIKTLPISRLGKVLENTYVCKISLPFRETNFSSSKFLYKAKKILFIPIIGDKVEKMSSKILGQPFVWEACGLDKRILAKDWFELSSYLRLGLWSELNSQLGEILHIRPKAAHSRDFISFEALGQKHQIVPLGFYFRKSWTQQLVEKHYAY